MINILNTVCSDYALAHILGIIKRIIDLIGIVVPILLLVGGTIVFAKASVNPEDKKTIKKFANSIASAIIVFLLPFIINIIMSIISAYSDVGVKSNGTSIAFDISNCWSESETITEDSNENQNTNESISDELDNLN